MAKKRIDTSASNVDLQYSNWFTQMIQLISPNSLDVVGGRATSKSEEIHANRTMEVSYEMPGSFAALTSDTFMNAKKNIWPSIINGWQRKGWVQDIHFVVDQRPPAHFKLPYKPVFSYKHTVTTLHGTHFKTISQDRPSIGAGDSYQHLFGDEAKYLNEKKLNKLTPAVRGEYVRFGSSHLYGGHTFTTDMPNPNQGEYDWILKKKDNMDMKLIQLILQAAFEINDMRAELVNLIKEKKEHQINLKKRQIARWEDNIRPLRRRATFFHVVSSFVNSDVLTQDYFKKLLQEMDFSEVMISVLSLTPTLEKGLAFYPTLSESNFYSDGIDYSRYEDTGLLDDVQAQSVDLRYVDTMRPLEGGMDTGNMCSLVIGQPSGNYLRLLKDFHTLPPAFLGTLAKKFRDYFQHHIRKELILYYDRAANKYQQVGDDHVSKFKDAVERDVSGNPTGWRVILKSRHQATISQQQEYELAMEFLSNNNSALPQLLIDKYNCKVLKSSMEKAQKIIKVDRRGNRTTHKDKSSEKLPSHRLPMESTNMSDAFKYFICREEYLSKLRGNTSLFSTSPSTH